MNESPSPGNISPISMTLYPTFCWFPIRVYPLELGIQSCSTHISANSPFHSSPHSKVDHEKSPTVQPWWCSRSLFIVEGCQSLKKDITWTRHTRIGAFELWSPQAADWYLIDDSGFIALCKKSWPQSPFVSHISTSKVARWATEWNTKIAASSIADEIWNESQCAHLKGNRLCRPTGE